MTPIGGTESSEELINSEEHCTAPSASSNGEIRVRDISELNNEAEAAPSLAVPTKKRTLPSWMLSSPDTSTNKKKKNDNSINSASQSNEAPSTSTSEITSNDNESLNENKSENAEKENNVEISVKQENCHRDESVENAEAEDNPAPANETDDNVASTSTQNPSTSSVTIKTEPKDDDDDKAVGHITPTSPKDIKPAIKVKKEEATSSTTRVSCRFGIRCYRRNPMHRQEEAHPGDSDYRRPDYPTPPDNTPPCPYGDLCYRRNPVHFQQYTHPPSTDFKKNLKAHRMQLRERKQLPKADIDSDGSDVFYDSSEEFNIGDEIDDDDDEEDEEDDF